MFSREELAGPNVEFSRHAAPKRMIARYRPMPRGRPAMTGCSLAQTELLRHRFWAAELLICGPQQLRYCEPAKTFGLRSRNRTIATFQNYWTAELSELRAKTAALSRICHRFWIARRQPNYCKHAKDFDPRALPNQQTAASSLLRGERFVCCETLISPTRI